MYAKSIRPSNSNRLLTSILQIEHEQLIVEYLTAIMKSFEEDVFPHRLEITTEIAKTFFEAHEYLFLIFDVKYARHQKSSNNKVPKKDIFWSENIPTL